MKTSLPTITAAAATTSGSLAGFRISCPCGMIWTNTFLVNAQLEARQHAEWHAAKAAK